MNTEFKEWLDVFHDFCHTDGSGIAEFEKVFLTAYFRSGLVQDTLAHERIPGFLDVIKKWREDGDSLFLSSGYAETCQICSDRKAKLDGTPRIDLLGESDC